MVIVDGGKILQSCPAACSAGTTIEVKSLFFNVPVRKKFQRSPSYDATEVHKILTFQALAHPHVSFKLLDNNKPVLHTTVLKEAEFLDLLKERIRELLSHEIFPALCKIDLQIDEYHVRGYIGKPFLTRHNRTGQYLFINHRAVVSPLISFAVKEGYGSALATNRHPIFILHIDMPGSLVDVNVHPQKREVRLRQEYKLKDIIVKGIQKGLQESGCTEMFSFDAPLSHPEINNFSYSFSSNERFPISFSREPEVKDKFVFINEDKNQSEQPIEVNTRFELKPETREVNSTQREPLSETLLFPEPPPKQRIKVLNTIKKYILIDGSTLQEQDGEGGICFVDQRAAHSRVIYERLLSNSDYNQSLSLQQLLIPHTFKTTPNEAAQIKEHLDYLNKIGILIKEFGPDTFVIDALPTIFGNTDVDALLNDLVDQMRNFHGNTTFTQELHKKIALASSRAAVSKDRKLSLEEAQELIHQLFSCECPYQCPQGRSTIVHLSEKNIDKQFQMRSS